MKNKFRIINHMNLTFFRFFFLACTVIILFLTSCNKEGNLVTHRNCDEVETEITDMNFQVGSYISSTFSTVASLNFEEAALSVFIEDWTFASSENGDCYTFTPLPQLIEQVNIKSSSSMTFDGVVYNPEEELNGLFKIHIDDQTYSIVEFINVQNNNPLLFHDEGDAIVLQLLLKPDVAIDQSLSIQFTFDDSKMIEVDVPNLKVIN